VNDRLQRTRNALGFSSESKDDVWTIGGMLQADPTAVLEWANDYLLFV
jgi:hypothetical protein